MRSKLQLSKHPIRFVKDLLSDYDRATLLEVGVYCHHPQMIADFRENTDLRLSDLSDDWLKLVLSQLRNGHELAFHSTVQFSGQKKHIPMVDLGGRHDEFKNLPVLREFCRYWGMDFAVYASGRSFHLYGNRLLSDPDWVRFMGGLLLLNIPGKSRLIDTRWVGHRLQGGSSALRWSNNSGFYKAYPKFVETLSSLIGP